MEFDVTYMSGSYIEANAKYKGVFIIEITTSDNKIYIVGKYEGWESKKGIVLDHPDEVGKYFYKFDSLVDAKEYIDSNINIGVDIKV